MSETSNIEWTDATFNPWEGCQKVGPGCDHCYAETRNARFGGGVAVNWGPGAPRRRTSVSNWNLPKRWDREHAEFFAQHGRRRRVFCASLADVFDNAVDPQWRADLFALIRSTPNLDWLLLTKRIGNARHMIEQALISLGDPATDVVGSWPWVNVWIGATVVNQAEADRDIPKLIAVPARVRFLSMEPLLGSVDLMKWLQPYTCADCSHHGSVNDCGPDGCDACGEDAAFEGRDTCKACNADDQSARASCPKCGSHRSYQEDAGFIWSSEQRLIDWVIVGGESGPGARPMHPDWARTLRDTCAAASVPLLFKQWGDWLPAMQDGNPAVPEQIINASDVAIHVGKKAAGRLLDGRTHDGYPDAA